MPKITIRDIAQMTNYSVGTVSRVLNKADNIDPKTYMSVMDVVRKYNYKPGRRGRPQARTPKTVTSKHIAIWAPNMTPSWRNNELWVKYINGIEKACSERGFDLIIKMSDSNTNFVREALNSDNYAGLLIKMTPDLDKIPDIEKLFTNVPSVGFGLNLPHYNIPQICLDNNAAGQLATSSLLKLGHKRIAFFNLEPSHRMFISRSLGYMEIMKAEGLYKSEYNYIDEGKERLFPMDPKDELPDCTRAIEYLKSLEEPPTAIIFGNDWTALGFLKACHRNDIRVPEDISVVSIDDMGSSCKIATPTLSAIAMPFSNITEYAGNVLIDIIENPDIYFAKQQSAHYLTGQFIQRESTKKLI